MLLGFIGAGVYCAQQGLGAIVFIKLVADAIAAEVYRVFADFVIGVG